MSFSEILIILAVLAGSISLAFWIDKKQCNQIGLLYDGSQYQVWTGCLISDKGRNIPISFIREVITNDQRN